MIRYSRGDISMLFDVLYAFQSSKRLLHHYLDRLEVADEGELNDLRCCICDILTEQRNILNHFIG